MRTAQAAAATLAILTLAYATTAHTPGHRSLCVETKDRISQEALDELVERPLALADAGQLAAGEAALEILVTERAHETRAHPAIVADTLMAFGVGLHTRRDDVPGAGEESLRYLRRAQQAYADAFGPDHPETGLAWATLGDAALLITPDQPTDEIIQALREAERIRVLNFGPRNVETAFARVRLGEALGAPVMTEGERYRIDAASALFEQAISDLGWLTCGGIDRQRVVERYVEMLLANRRPARAMKAIGPWLERSRADDRGWRANHFAHALRKRGYEAEAAALEARYPMIEPEPLPDGLFDILARASSAALTTPE